MREAWVEVTLPLHSVRDGRCSCGLDDCRSVSKHPRITLRWQTPKATSDKNQIWQWWRTWPEANIGVATGRGSGVFVLDIDGPKGLDTLEHWRTKRNWQAVTLTAVTSRGLHLYFLQEELTVPTSAGKLGDGIDVRGDGGYVVAPPSVHASGHTYVWEDPGCPVADPPGWLLESLSSGECR